MTVENNSFTKPLIQLFPYACCYAFLMDTYGIHHYLNVFLDLSYGMLPDFLRYPYGCLLSSITSLTGRLT